MNKKLSKKRSAFLLALALALPFTGNPLGGQFVPVYAAEQNVADSYTMEKIPDVIPSDVIGLRTNGAKIIEKKPVLTTEGKIAFYAVRGLIFPVDSKAENIEFQVNLPAEWNKKLVQFGGGAFNGTLVSADGHPIGADKADVPPVLQGYVTYGSDGGHKAGTWESEWALNDENLRNFAHEQLKKTHDVAVYLAKQFYGQAPQKSYFIGGSNGGREGLKAAQEYPDDYDGVVSFYPVLNWVPKAIKDHENAMNVLQNNGAGWLSESEYELVKHVVLEVTDKLDGKEDGLIGDVSKADEKKAEIIKRLQGHLSKAKLETLEKFWSARNYSQPLKNDFHRLPGYSVSQLLIDHGEPFSYNQFGTEKGKRDGTMMMFSDGVIAHQIVRRKNYNVDDFKPEQWKKEILAASSLLDATNVNLDLFVKHGGKLILLHGTADEVVAIQGTTDYYKKLAERYGEKLAAFSRYYMVPGFGHETGSVFTMGRDLLKDLDDWVVSGKAPENLAVKDQNKKTYGRIQVLHPYVW